MRTLVTLVKCTLLIFLLCFSHLLQAQEPKLMLPISEAEFRGKPVFSNDGKYIWCSDLIWNASTGHLLVNMKEGSPFCTLIKEGDGTLTIKDKNEKKVLARFKNYGLPKYTAPAGKFIRRLNYTDFQVINEGKTLATIKTKSEVFSPVVYNAAGTVGAISEHKGNIVSCYDLNTGKLVRTFKGEMPSFSPDSEKILVLQGDSAVGVWNIQTGDKTCSIQGEVKFDYAEFFTEENQIITGGNGNKTQIWDSETGQLLLTLKHHNEESRGVLFIPGSKEFLTIMGARYSQYEDASTVYRWKSTGQKYFLDYNGNNPSLSPDGKKLITTYSGAVRIWDVASIKEIGTIKGHTSKVTCFDIDNANDRIAVGDWEGNVNIWRFSPGLEFTHLTTNDIIYDIKYSKDKKELLFASAVGEVGIVDMDKNKVIWQGDAGDWAAAGFFPGNKVYSTYDRPGSVVLVDRENRKELNKFVSGSCPLIADVQPAIDGKHLLINDDCGNVFLWNAAGGSEAKKLGNFLSARYSDDGRFIIAGGRDKKIIVWDAATLKVVARLSARYDRVEQVALTSDNKLLAAVSAGKSVRLYKLSDKSFWDIPTKLKSIAPGTLQFSTDGSKLIIADTVAEVWDVQQRKLLFALNDHKGRINRLGFMNRRNRIVTFSEDHTGKLWDAGNGQLRLTFLSIDSTDYFARTPEGYYMSTPNAAKLLHFVTDDLKIITFEQLDVSYNRPDKVLEALGGVTEEQVLPYRKAYEKRIRKLGLDSVSLNASMIMPEADFANREAIAYEQSAGALDLHIIGKDPANHLDRLNIWVNEVPLLGSRGEDLKQRKSYSIDTIINVNLTPGMNVIETSVTNVNGMESFRMPLQVNYTPQKLVFETVHFVGIGIDRFQDSRHNLQWSVKDIRDLALRLKEKFEDFIEIDTLFNEAVTVENVTALKKRLWGTSEEDKVLLAYSGHGLLSKEYDYYLSTYGVNFQKPEEGGLPYDALESLLDSIPARKKLMLIDACHSGEVDKEELQKIAAVNQSAPATEGARGNTPLLLHQKKVGMKNSFELMQELFVNVGRSTGATVISAAGGTQFALERKDLKNGVFTYSILEYMKDHPSATVSELKQYVNKRVPELTKGAQVPTTRTETKAVDWKVW